MNWFRENRFLGALVIILGGCIAGGVGFLFSARSDWNRAATRFQQATGELNRLERLAPYPSGENLRKMKAHADDYSTALARLKDELKTCGLPVAPMAPNEFQSHLRLAMNAVAGKARSHRVKLPDKFYLGFDEFASSLPSEAAAPQLGQELAQIEWLLDTLFEAGVDALTSFRRMPWPNGQGNALAAASSPNGKPAPIAQAPPGPLERKVVEASFISAPAAARKVLNQIAGTKQHFFIVRLLRVRNEKDKGPSREAAAEASSAAFDTSPSPVAAPEEKQSTPAVLNFIVGNERIETSARIEIVRFTF